MELNLLIYILMDRNKEECSIEMFPFLIFIYKLWPI